MVRMQDALKLEWTRSVVFHRKNGQGLMYIIKLGWPCLNVEWEESMQPRFDINSTTLVIARLEKGERVKAFDCGDADLNDFILNECPLYGKEKLAVTYVLEDESDTEHEHIVAFFSLSNDRISVSDFNTKAKYNRFSRRFNNRKRLRSYPAAKIDA